MKKPFYALLIFVAPIAVVAEPSIKIGSVTFKLAYAPPESPVGIREYVLPGEGVDTWTRLASVRTYGDESDVQGYLGRVGQQVMQSHPSAKARLLKHDKSGELVLDFLTFTPDSSIAEWNLMRAKFQKGKGLIVYQYAARFPTTPELAPSIIAERTKMLDGFMEATFQEEANSERSAAP